ncbi:M48 family metalloprotease [Paenibacillus lemnae]|uniref:Uncharacterized protein n=1 Tax=Paenibacillus lemnae TaxID=1330551 RepID=A0A848M7X9_PAELE|nr:M48 family metalloprotease [Paenibacillus lemnae]NMO96311.1 hypothetical protein [Paenibacillus lemnae]
MTDKDSVKKRFLSEFSGAVEDWDIHLLEAGDDDEKKRYQKILEEQEEYGNIRNYGLGRDLWYSNDHYINFQIQDLIENAQDDTVLYEELRKVWVGKVNKRKPNAMAINMDEEFDGYLITIHFEMDLDLEFLSLVVANYLCARQSKDDSERKKLVTEMTTLFCYLLDKDYFVKQNKGSLEVEKGSVSNVIASQILEASMKFVLGHEIGHHLLKHTATDGRNIVNKFKPMILTHNAMQLDEFAADNFGFDLLVRGMNPLIPNPHFLIAPLIVILLLAIYDESPEQPSTDHPSLRDRYLNLLNKISEFNEYLANIYQEILNEIASWIRDYFSNFIHWRTEWWKV